MRILRIVGGAVGAVAAAYLGGYVLPRHFRASTEVMIPAPLDQVFRLFESQDGILAWWSAVAKQVDGGPKMQIEALEGPTSGVGTRVDFIVNGVTGETWEIVESDPGRRIMYAIDFKSLVATRVLTFESVPGGTRVVWTETAEIASPLWRYLNLFLGKAAVIEKFDVALRGAKTAVESQT